MHRAHPLPNILTSARLAAGLLLFVFLGAAVGIIPWLSDHLTPEQQILFAELALITFVIGAATDFVDGWAARRLNAETAWGATLDPIADKLLICGAILGLISLYPQPHVATPGALILFREFAVSALREGASSRGVKLQVTTLAKWKTTIQMVALGLQLLLYVWRVEGLGLYPDPEIMGPIQVFVADPLMWVAAAVTLWTGWDYLKAARKALPHEAED